MAWEISISPEGWQQIRDNLETWEKDALIEAITDDTLERILEEGGSIEDASQAAYSQWKDLERLHVDTLADCAFELIAQTNTCDNGGFAYWIDREGDHKVYIR